MIARYIDTADGSGIVYRLDGRTVRVRQFGAEVHRFDLGEEVPESRERLEGHKRGNLAELDEHREPSLRPRKTGRRLCAGASSPPSPRERGQDPT